MLLTTFGIWLTYLIGSYLFNQKVGYMAAFFYSINGFIIELSVGRTATDHTDVFFLFFVELAIFCNSFCSEKNIVFNLLAGPATGAAILCKWLPALIVMPIWVLLVMEKRRVQLEIYLLQLLLFCLCCALVFLPWQLYIFNAFPQEAYWESAYKFKACNRGLGRPCTAILLFLFSGKIRIQYGELIYLPLLYFGWSVCSNAKDKKRLSVLI